MIGIYWLNGLGLLRWWFVMSPWVIPPCGGAACLHVDTHTANQRIGSSWAHECAPSGLQWPTTISFQRKSFAWHSVLEINVRIPMPLWSGPPECTCIQSESSHSPVYCHLVSRSVTTWICCCDSQVLISSNL